MVSAPTPSPDDHPVTRLVLPLTDPRRATASGTTARRGSAAARALGTGLAARVDDPSRVQRRGLLLLARRDTATGDARLPGALVRRSRSLAYTRDPGLVQVLRAAGIADLTRPPSLSQDVTP